MIREATLDDVPKMTLLLGGLICDINLRANPEAIADMLVKSISAKRSLVIASINHDGELAGLMVTTSGPITWAEKQFANIECLHTTVVGDGILMLNRTMLWAKKRRAIQLVTYTSPVSSRVDKLLLANGFESTGSMIVWRRYHGSV